MPTAWRRGKSCTRPYTDSSTCYAQLSSESCSPICSNYSSTINCLDCLINNGQANLVASNVQQMVWDIEAECSLLGVNVATQELDTAATAT